MSSLGGGKSVEFSVSYLALVCSGGGGGVGKSGTIMGLGSSLSLSPQTTNTREWQDGMNKGKGLNRGGRVGLREKEKKKT